MLLITKGRDKTFTIKILDENDDPIRLTNWTRIETRFLKNDNTVLSKRAPVTQAVNEVQKIEFNLAPDAGTFKLKFNNQITTALSYAAIASDVQNALNAMEGVDGILVTGNFVSGFTVSFAGAMGGRNHPLVESYENTLTELSNPILITITEITVGSPANGIEILDEYAGKVRIRLSEEDTLLLKKGIQDLDIIVSVGADDLNIAPQLRALDVRESPF